MLATGLTSRTITGAQFQDQGIKEKDLFLIPYDLARELRRKGWYLRANTIWAKRRVVSAARTNRPVHSYETVFFLSKAYHCVYNHDALMEAGLGGIARDGRYVWNIASSNVRSEHTATMPEELAARCILAGSHVGDRVLDPFAGAGTTGVLARRHGRHVDLIEASRDYAALARARLDACHGQTPAPAKIKIATPGNHSPGRGGKLGGPH